MTKKFLVTGCAGFIASQVTGQLLDGGHEVIGWDNLNDAYDPALKRYRMSGLADRGGFTFEKVDIACREQVENQDISGVDAVFNLAARAGVRQSQEDPWSYVDANTTGTLNMLEACRTSDIARMVLASTSSLYGAHNERPFREDADTNRPLSPYAASKKGAEAMAASYTHLYGIHTPVFRYFTVYGPAGRPDMSVFRFIKWIAEGTAITLFGDGTQERDFTYVDDIARGTILGAGVQGHEIINLGNDSPHSMNDLIRMIESEVGKRARVDYRPMPRADVTATWADTSKARELLSWSPDVSLNEGIRRAVTWAFQNQRLVAQTDVGVI